MDNFKKIGKNLSKLRTLNNMTQDKVASLLGINRVELSYYENGSRKIPLDILNRLSDLYRVELIELLEMNDADIELKTAMAFRASELNEINFSSVADFGKIIKNYLKMKKLKQKA